MASIEDIKALADIQYAAQTTGVATTTLNAAKEAVGIDTSDPFSYIEVQELLESYGYAPGTSNFYGGSTTGQTQPDDEGLQIHYNAVQTAINDYGYLESTEANKAEYGGKIDPTTGELYKFMVNDNVANAQLIEDGLAAQGADVSSTIASTPTSTPSWEPIAEDKYTEEYNRQNELFGGDLDNSLQWANIDKLKKKKPILEVPTVPGVTSSSNTDILNLGQGEVAPVQAVPQTVTQQVTPPSYYNQPQIAANTSISNEEAGTFSKPLQTAGLSAVPTTATYKTHYAGTPGLVDPTLVAPVGGGVQQVIYGNNLGQQQVVTEVNGSPTTYVPPGFVRKGTPQEVAQQESQNMAQGGAVRGYGSGGDVALIKLAQMNGFKGDDVATARSFMNASEGLRNKVTAMGALMNRGGLAMAQGGAVPNQATIGGQPHRLAYVNPQEEALMKAAGGAGIPSYGGIPAYTTFGPGSTVGETVTDPMTGYKYTWNGTSWDMSGATDQASSFPVQQAQRTQNLITQTMQPTQAPVSYQQPVATDFIPVDAGQATPIAPYAEAATVATVQQANQQDTPVAETYDFTPAYTAVQAETSALQPEQGVVSDNAQVAAQQQTTSAVTGMQGAQGLSTDVVAPAPRVEMTGELIDPVADAASAAAFTEQVQAATATPSAQATVQGQLEGLMTQFEGGETPAWAAGSMRTAMATLSARGLGASSMAGQAVIQATMEAALPIAQMDAQVQAQFESQNLTNRQQRAMLSAQQRATFLGMEFDQGFQARVQNSARIGDIANMNFSAEQNIALENARAANTMNLNNLSNRQAMVMAEAAALSNLDMANLNNRQQAAVQNAQSFLQMDMTNLSNEQQTAIFKSQQNVQALFTDQAAENASAQFNATSQNQTDQYFANLRSQTSQFNASQQNAMDQFNVNSVNALREFNSEIQQQRDLFNAQNGLLIAQSNAQWRQTVSTANTAAQNESNMNFAKTINALTATNLDAYWQRERDVMSFAYASGESAADRLATVLVEELKAEAQAAYADAQGQGGLFATLLKGGLNYMSASAGKGIILN